MLRKVTQTVLFGVLVWCFAGTAAHSKSRVNYNNLDFACIPNFQQCVDILGQCGESGGFCQLSDDESDCTCVVP